MAVQFSLVLNVSNPEKSAEFYRSIGFPVRREKMGGFTFHEVRIGRTTVSLIPKHPPWEIDEETKAWLSAPAGCGVLLFLGTTSIEPL
ncbi:MAG: VOC family protein, partial [Methanobacteriota archaeon]